MFHRVVIVVLNVKTNHKQLSCGHLVEIPHFTHIQIPAAHILLFHAISVCLKWYFWE